MIIPNSDANTNNNNVIYENESSSTTIYLDNKLDRAL